MSIRKQPEIMNKLRRCKRERGASLVEYALLVALIALVAMVGMNQLGPAISQKFTDIGTTVQNAGGGGGAGGNPPAGNN